MVSSRILLSACVSLLLLSISLAAQSTNPSNPTLVSGEYTGKGPTKETDFYFSVTAGPGDVSVTLKIKAKNYSTFARIEVGNDPSNLIAMANMNASTATGPATVTKDFNLSMEQSVRIKLTLDGNLADYTLSVNGGGSSSGPSVDGENDGTGKMGTGGKVGGKMTSGTAAKIGVLGSTGGGKPKFETQNSNGDSGNKLSFTCPLEVMYKIVPAAGWDAGLSGQKLFRFSQAAVVEKQLWCTYEIVGGGESATIYQAVPTGYKCERYNGGSKSRDFVCTQAVTAAIVSPGIELPFGR